MVRLPPLSKSGRPKTLDTKGRPMPDVWRGAAEGPQNAAFGRSRWNSLVRQGGLRRSNERKKKAYDGRQVLNPSLQLGQLHLRVDVIRSSRDEVGQDSAEPRAARRSRNIEAREDRGIAGCDKRDSRGVDSSSMATRFESWEPPAGWDAFLRGDDVEELAWEALAGWHYTQSIQLTPPMDSPVQAQRGRS